MQSSTMDPSAEKALPVNAAAEVKPIGDTDSATTENSSKSPVPLSMKILSIVVVSMIGFGGHWSSGVTGALKSTLKKVS